MRGFDEIEPLLSGAWGGPTAPVVGESASARRILYPDGDRVSQANRERCGVIALEFAGDWRSGEEDATSRVETVEGLVRPGHVEVLIVGRGQIDENRTPERCCAMDMTAVR